MHAKTLTLKALLAAFAVALPVCGNAAAAPANTKLPPIRFIDLPVRMNQSGMFPEGNSRQACFYGFAVLDPVGLRLPVYVANGIVLRIGSQRSSIPFSARGVDLQRLQSLAVDAILGSSIEARSACSTITYQPL